MRRGDPKVYPVASQGHRRSRGPKSHALSQIVAIWVSMPLFGFPTPFTLKRSLYYWQLSKLKRQKTKVMETLVKA